MNEQAEKTDTSNPNDTLMTTIESTGDQIFKIPETGADLMVTGAALIGVTRISFFGLLIHCRVPLLPALD